MLWVLQIVVKTDKIKSRQVNKQSCIHVKISADLRMFEDEEDSNLYLTRY